MEQRLASHPEKDLNPPQINHTPYQGDNGQDILRKDVAWLVSVSKLAFSPKKMDMHSLHRDNLT